MPRLMDFAGYQGVMFLQMPLNALKGIKLVCQKGQCVIEKLYMPQTTNNKAESFGIPDYQKYGFEKRDFLLYSQKKVATTAVIATFMYHKNLICPVSDDVSQCTCNQKRSLCIWMQTVFLIKAVQLLTIQL